MKKIKAISRFLEPFTLIATFIGFGATVLTNNYNYLAVPSISSIPIVTLSRLKNKDDLKNLIESYERKIEKLNLEGDVGKQNETIKKLTQQTSSYQKQLSKTKILLDSKTEDLEEQISNYQYLYSLYSDREQTLKEYQARISELEQIFNTEEEPDTLEDNSYDIIFDRTSSRQVLIEALTNAREQLILVCPWLTEYGLNYQIENLMVQLLTNDVKVFIGWGHLSDLDDNLPLNENNLLNSEKAYGWKYKKLSRLKQLQNQYKNLNLKLLGTHEKYLVCDHKFAMISSHNFLASGDTRREREISLKTTDKRIINRLICRYNE